ncbi:MAG: PDZ domain-containing protein [Gemmatimonadaceae bacterium]
MISRMVFHPEREVAPASIADTRETSRLGELAQVPATDVDTFPLFGAITFLSPPSSPFPEDLMYRPALLALLIPATFPSALVGQGRPPATAASELSAPVADMRYEVAFDRQTATRRMLHVTTSFTTPGRDPVLLSLPAWTPGAYEISNYARSVQSFTATSEGKPLAWDKLDYDTWRIRPNGAKTITVAFDFLADTLDNAMAWARPDFAFFNGTNVFLYPEGRGTDFSASVTVKTESSWNVVTGMSSTGPRSYSAKNYHDVVDMPFFVGTFDVDSTRVADHWIRLASYPAGMLAGDARKELWSQVERFLPTEIAVTGEVPFEHYSILTVFDSSFGGGSALEHQNSHLGIYTPFIIGNQVLPSITAHEIFHLWNVKRMRPAEMVPYRYDRPEPTPWLWVSEGITDYYADLALVRGGVVDSLGFVGLTNGKIMEVGSAPAVALEDASLSTWIHPTDGTGYLYYPKGSLAGFLLDVMIRDASDNRKSLDDVMRSVYNSTYKTGRGFTAQDWWGAVSAAAGGKSFTEFYAKYIDGREAFPWASALPLAGLRLKTDTIHEPRVGVFTNVDSLGTVIVTALEPEGAAAQAGVLVGDVLLEIGEVPVSDATFGPRFRARYAKAEGQSIPIKVRRGAEVLSLPMKVQTTARLDAQLQWDPGASPKAVRIRHGLMTGTTGQAR